LGFGFLERHGPKPEPRGLPDPSEPRQGTLGRNSLRASALRQVDLVLTKRLQLNAHLKVQLRIEAFNLFNIANFGPPNSTFQGAQFGRPNQTYAQSLGTGTLTYGGLAA
jgi:hypothetical protein